VGSAPTPHRHASDPASMEHGIPEVMAAGLLASIGLLDIIGPPSRAGSRTAGTTAICSAGITAFGDSRYCSCPTRSARLPRPRRLRDLLWTRLGGHGAPTARLAADTFGRENVGIMFGWIAASHQLGAATRRLRWRPVTYVARRLSGDVHERRPALPIRGASCSASARRRAAADAGRGGRRSLEPPAGRSLALAAAVFAALAVPRGALAHAASSVRSA